jgi:hypothetical protein
MCNFKRLIVKKLAQYLPAERTTNYRHLILRKEVSFDGETVAILKGRGRSDRH